MDPLFTIGHSNRSWEQTLFMLKAHSITVLADVRRIPRSRWPQYNQAFLVKELGREGISYAHIERLGSMRDVRQDSPNAGWSMDPLLQGFADHMASAEFREGIEELLAQQGPSQRVAFMCSEGKWEKCHRRLIADFLVVRGLDVRHILSADPPVKHSLTPGAVVQGERITYPSVLRERSDRRRKEDKRTPK